MENPPSGRPIEIIKRRQNKKKNEMWNEAHCVRSSRWWSDRWKSKSIKK